MRANVRFFPIRGRRPARRIPGLQALPAEHHPRFTGMGRPSRRGRSSHAAHRRRAGRPWRRVRRWRRAWVTAFASSNAFSPAEVGAGPTAIARAQRAQTARILIETTRLPMADIAFAAGFSSVRQFNDTVHAVFASSPSHLRRPGAGAASSRDPTGRSTTHRPAPPLPPPPLSRQSLRASGRNRRRRRRRGPRTHLPTHPPARATARASSSSPPPPITSAAGPILSDLRDLTATIARCRWLLDLDADPIAVDRHLAPIPPSRPVIAKAPGRRVPRCVDGAELAIRAVLGQQVSTAAAQTHAGRLVDEHGEPVTDAGGGLTHLFPSPDALQPTPSRRCLGPGRAHCGDGRCARRRPARPRARL